MVASGLLLLPRAARHLSLDHRRRPEGGKREEGENKEKEGGPRRRREADRADAEDAAAPHWNGPSDSSGLRQSSHWASGPGNQIGLSLKCSLSFHVGKQIKSGTFGVILSKVFMKKNVKDI